LSRAIDYTSEALQLAGPHIGSIGLRPSTSWSLAFALIAILGHAACGSSPSAPAPLPTPIPTPTPAPTPTPDPSIPPESSGCGKPYPPPLHGINVKIHVRAPEYWTLDATPLVGPSSEYCREIGYTDGREFCPTRLEGDPQRTKCEAWILGNAEDTGTWGPTWSRDWEHWCTTFEQSGCEHHPGNPLSLHIQVGGKYQACKGEEICGEVLVDR
jgi:hypothetical protein